MKNNQFTTIGVVVVILGLLYYVFFLLPGSSTPTLSTTGDATSSSISQDLIILLTNLRTIRLDNAIFNDQAFASLSDFGVIIPQQPVGKRNPFLPLNGAAPAPSSGVKLRL